MPTPDPQIWNQPGVRVVPSPTPAEPWRVDLQPVNIPQSSPTPKPVGELNPSTPPDALPAEKGLCDQYPDIAACAPAQKEFCEQNPDSLACQKMDGEDVEVPDLENKEISVSITPDSGWGSGGGSCPADRAMSHASFSFAPYCSFASGIRPVLVAVAWLVAAGILIGYKAD